MNNSNNVVAISGTFDKSQANLVEGSKVDPNYTADLMTLAQQIQTADISIQSNVTNKLSIIVEQIQFLQKQAMKILEKAKIEKELHNAACNINKKPGQTYYYYERASGQKYITIMSPEDWGSNCPHTFLGGYRLEYDNSWVALKDCEKIDERKALIQQVMNKTLAITEALN